YAGPGHTVWFEGHWGFQYYMEQLGAKPLDLRRPILAPQDFLLVPNSSPDVSPPDPRTAHLIDSRTFLPNRYSSTLNCSLGAGFYASALGPLPFALGRPAPDYYFVFRPLK